MTKEQITNMLEKWVIYIATIIKLNIHNSYKLMKLTHQFFKEIRKFKSISTKEDRDKLLILVSKIISKHFDINAQDLNDITDSYNAFMTSAEPLYKDLVDKKIEEDLLEKIADMKTDYEA